MLTSSRLEMSLRTKSPTITSGKVASLHRLGQCVIQIPLQHGPQRTGHLEFLPLNMTKTSPT
jgi:hypothetical protein